MARKNASGSRLPSPPLVNEELQGVMRQNTRFKKHMHQTCSKGRRSLPGSLATPDGGSDATLLRRTAPVSGAPIQQVLQLPRCTSRQGNVGRTEDVPDVKVVLFRSTGEHAGVRYGSMPSSTPDSGPQTPLPRYTDRTIYTNIKTHSSNRSTTRPVPDIATRTIWNRPPSFSRSGPSPSARNTETTTSPTSSARSASRGYSQTRPRPSPPRAAPLCTPPGSAGPPATLPPGPARHPFPTA